MTETAIKSILRLFAILGNLRNAWHGIDEINDYEYTRQITENYLNQLTNPNNVSKYLLIFDFHYKNIQKQNPIPSHKKLTVFSVKILLICEQLNQSINIKEKTFLLLQMLDIMKNPDDTLHEDALELVNSFAQLLSVDPNDFDMLLLFVFGSIKNKGRSNSFLIISGKKMDTTYRHHLYRENLNGTIVVYHHTRLNQYYFRLEEHDDILALNAKPILLNRIYLFEKGYSIRSPKIHTIYYTDITSNFLQRTTSAVVKLDAINIEFQFKNSENGIKRFNFTAKSGELIGIMGGSGVGKTTLLSILNGTQPPDYGQVLINGIDIYKNSEKITGIIGYVPQDDFLIEELTVFENLLFNAKFCFGNLNEEEIINKVNNLLEELSLYEIRNLKVGSTLNKYISGGQRKRLNIALELMREPMVLLVDEPTSGLSSSDSEKVMELLKEQTYNGKLVILNIHQPSSNIFKMLDKLLVMDKGGTPVYYGNAIDSLSYFKNIFQSINAEENECLWCGNINPEQILEIIETNKVDERGYDLNERYISTEEWYDLYITNIDSQVVIKPERIPIPKSNFQTPSKLKQFALFLIRNIKCKITDTQYMIINILEAPLLALILAFFTRYIEANQKYVFGDNDNIPAFIFMSVVVALFLGMMGSAEEIIRDAKQLKRESFLNLSRQSYINSKVIYLFFVSAIQMLIYVLISNYILEIKGMNFAYWIILFSTSACANMIGLNLSAGLKSVVAIYIFIPLLLIPQLLLSGTVVKFDKLHPWLSSGIYVPVIGDFITSRWAYEAIMVHQFKDNEYEKLFYNLEQSESNATYCTNYWIPELLNKIENCQKLLSNKINNQNQIKSDLLLLKNELNKLSQNLKITPYKYVDSLRFDYFNDSIALKTSEYLRHARSISIKILNLAIEKRDQYTEKLSQQLGSHDYLVELKKQYYNENLASQLLNKTEPRQIIEYKNEFFRKYEPVFYPGESKVGRAHYYAPAKRIGSLLIDTLLFNLIVIWIMTALFYYILLKDLLKKTILKMENFKLKKE